MDLDETDEPYNEEEQDENFVNKRVKKVINCLDFLCPHNLCFAFFIVILDFFI